MNKKCAKEMRNFNESILNGITQRVSPLKSSLTSQPGLHPCLKATVLNRPCIAQCKYNHEIVVSESCGSLALEVNAVAE